MITAQNLCEEKLEYNDIMFFLQIIEIILKIPRSPNAGEREREGICESARWE